MTTTRLHSCLKQVAPDLRTTKLSWYVTCSTPLHTTSLTESKKQFGQLLQWERHCMFNSSYKGKSSKQNQPKAGNTHQTKNTGIESMILSSFSVIGKKYISCLKRGMTRYKKNKNKSRQWERVSSEPIWGRCVPASCLRLVLRSLGSYTAALA